MQTITFKSTMCTDFLSKFANVQIKKNKKIVKSKQHSCKNNHGNASGYIKSMAPSTFFYVILSILPIYESAKLSTAFRLFICNYFKPHIQKLCEFCIRVLSSLIPLIAVEVGWNKREGIKKQGGWNKRVGWNFLEKTSI